MEHDPTDTQLCPIREALQQKTEHNIENTFEIKFQITVWIARQVIEWKMNSWTRWSKTKNQNSSEKGYESEPSTSPTNKNQHATRHRLIGLSKKLGSFERYWLLKIENPFIAKSETKLSAYQNQPFICWH